MAETQNPAPVSIVPEAEKTNFLKSFIDKHPRAAKVAGFTAAAGAVVGALAVCKSLSKEETSNSDTVVYEGAFDSSNPEITTIAEA